MECLRVRQNPCSALASGRACREGQYNNISAKNLHWFLSKSLNCGCDQRPGLARLDLTFSFEVFEKGLLHSHALGCRIWLHKRPGRVSCWVYMGLPIDFSAAPSFCRPRPASPTPAPSPWASAVAVTRPVPRPAFGRALNKESAASRVLFCAVA